MSDLHSVNKLLNQAPKMGFRIKYCKSGVIKVFSDKNKDQMYTLHIGGPALHPLKCFLEKNK